LVGAMMEMLGIGDLHLTDDQGKGGLARYISNPNEYVMAEVERCIQWGIKKHIDHVIFYGDIFENPRGSYEGQLAFLKTIKRYPDIMFHTILGNHDKLGRNSSEGHSLEIIKQTAPKNLSIYLEDTVVNINKRQVKFCPWPSKAFDPKILNIGHIEVKGSRGDSGRIMEGDELSKSNSIVCMGHLHTNHQVRNTYFSGTIYQTNFGESLPKFFHHIIYNSVDDYEINSIPFDPKYKLFNCVAESQDDIDALSKDFNHLIKLVVKDGADVVIPNNPNIVITKAFKTKSELATILTEDLLQGSELVVKTSDFFKEWIAAQSVPVSLKNRASRLRKEILGGSKNGDFLHSD
jgi:DNA repair exonuclease SbcCD nuclease subunit